MPLQHSGVCPILQFIIFTKHYSLFFFYIYFLGLINNSCWQRYLPPYTLFMPLTEQKTIKKEGDDEKKVTKSGLFVSQLSFLTICIFLISITERQKLRSDPLNFNVLNITLEVIRYVSILHILHSYYIDQERFKKISRN